MTIVLAALALIGLAVVLVGPGPVWVARWRFLYRVPRAAVVLWQAGAVTAVLAIVAAAAGMLHLVVTDIEAIGRPGPVVVVLTVLMVAFAAQVLVRLAWTLITVARQTAARRERHRSVVDVLGRLQSGFGLPGLRVLAETAPLAYCLPGIRGSRVVVSEGTLAELDPDEVDAVIAHELAHVRARHDLVLDTFTAVNRAFPHLIRSEIPVRQCRLLVEMLADDAARRRTGALPLARAMITLAGAPVPAAALGAGAATELRVRRLSDPATPRRGLTAAGVYVLAATLFAAPFVIMGTAVATAV